MPLSESLEQQATIDALEIIIGARATTVYRKSLGNRSMFSRQEFKAATLNALEIIIEAKATIVYRSAGWLILNNAALYLSDRFWQEIKTCRFSE